MIVACLTDLGLLFIQQNYTAGSPAYTGLLCAVSVLHGGADEHIDDADTIPRALSQVVPPRKNNKNCSATLQQIERALDIVCAVPNWFDLFHPEACANRAKGNSLEKLHSIVSNGACHFKNLTWIQRKENKTYQAFVWASGCQEYLH